MLAAYRDALAYLPESSAAPGDDHHEHRHGASAIAAQQAQTEQTRAAVPDSRQANELLQQHRYTDAVAQFLTVLQNYPQSTQAACPLKGINDSIAGLGAQASADSKGHSDQVTALNAQLASVQKDLADRTTEIGGIKKSLMGMVGMSGDPAATPTDSVMTAVTSKFGDLAGAGEHHPTFRPGCRKQKTTRRRSRSRSTP